MAYYKEKEFKKWLEDDTKRWNDANSVKQYTSGVGALINWLNVNKRLFQTNKSVTVKNFQDYLELINKDSDRDTLFSAAQNIIQKEIDKTPPPSNKSTLQNYKSYLAAYEDFLREQPLSSNAKLPNNHLKMLRKNSNSATYTREELIDEFVGRITSQDRISMSKDILFPISIIRKIWPDETVDWAKNICEKIFLIVRDNNNKFKELQIKDIEHLRIEKTGEVKIKTSKTGEYILYTSYSGTPAKVRGGGANRTAS